MYCITVRAKDGLSLPVLVIHPCSGVLAIGSFNSKEKQKRICISASRNDQVFVFLQQEKNDLCDTVWCDSTDRSSGSTFTMSVMFHMMHRHVIQ